MTAPMPAMEEAAQNLGCTGFRRFRKITLPLIMPGLVAGGTIVFIWSFTELGTGNVFIVTDLPDRVAAAQKLITELDRPSAQVEIEARIVVSSRNFSRQLGVQWGFLNQQVPQYGNTTNLSFPNSVIVNGQGQGALSAQNAPALNEAAGIDEQRLH